MIYTVQDPRGPAHQLSLMASEMLRIRLDFNESELSGLRGLEAFSGAQGAKPALPNGALFLEIELGECGMYKLYRQALNNRSGLTQTLHGSLVVRTWGGRRR